VTRKTMINTSEITLLPGHDHWAQNLATVAQTPLALLPDSLRIMTRFEAWWQQAALNRPLFIAKANADPTRPITRRLDLLDDADAWFTAKKLDLIQTRCFGDALPTLRVDFGPACLGALLGAPVEFSSETDTTWTHAFLNDEWNNAPDWTIHSDNVWWQRLQTLLDKVCADAAGQYLLRTPSFGGGSDVLLNMRGSGNLCLDTLEQPATIVAALDKIYMAWRQAFSSLFDAATRHGVGLLHWIELWSAQPYVVPECDFMCMIGPHEFRKICLPDIARTAGSVGRAAFHLDGPDAARRIDELLEVAEITAVQFTPGAGSPSALAWLPMFEKIQASGRSLLIFTPPHEVLPLSEQLRPEGLAIIIESLLSLPEAEELDERWMRRWGA
jgi:hypothetical protein